MIAVGLFLTLPSQNLLDFLLFLRLKFLLLNQLCGLCDTNLPFTMAFLQIRSAPAPEGPLDIDLQMYIQVSSLTFLLLC